MFIFKKKIFVDKKSILIFLTKIFLVHIESIIFIFLKIGIKIKLFYIKKCVKNILHVITIGINEIN